MCEAAVVYLSSQIQVNVFPTYYHSGVFREVFRASFMIILEAAVCGAVELYCVILTGASIIQPTLIDLNEGGQNNRNRCT